MFWFGKKKKEEEKKVVAQPPPDPWDVLDRELDHMAANITDKETLKKVKKDLYEKWIKLARKVESDTYSTVAWEPSHALSRANKNIRRTLSLLWSAFNFSGNSVKILLKEVEKLREEVEELKERIDQLEQNQPRR